MIKLAIISPGFLPVPAIKGGAVEQLITSILDENEKNHTFDIDIYTIYDSKLNKINYKYTNIITVGNLNKKYMSHFLHGIKNFFYKIKHNHKKDTFMGYQFAKKYRRNYYDAVLVENNMDIFLSLLPQLSKEKKYFHLHNDFNNNDPAKTIYKTKQIIKYADQILVVSDFLKEKLLKLGATKVLVIWNGIEAKQLKTVDDSKKYMIKKKIGASCKDVIVTYIGRIDPSKGIQEYLEAMQNLKEKKHIKGLIIGDYKNGYGEKLKEKYKSKNIIFMGYIENKHINEFLAITDILVVPTQVEEAFGLSALEAMSMGVPIVASDSGNLPFLLRDTRAPIIERNEKFVLKLTQTIYRLSSLSSVRKKIGEVERKNSQEYPQSKKDYFNEIIQVF